MKKIFLMLTCFSFLFVSMNFAQTGLIETSMFRGNPELTGVYHTKPINQLNQLQFIFRTGGAIRSTPTVVDGMLFIGSGDGNFYALNNQTGIELWRFKTDAPITSTAAVADGIVWFTSMDGYFYALDTKSGKELWKYKMEKDLPGNEYQDYWDYYQSSPCIFKGNVYVGGGDGFLYGFNCLTKKNIWKFNANSRIRTTTAVSGNLILFGTMDGHLTALDAMSGLQKWSFASDGASFHFSDRDNDRTSIFCSPSVANGIVTVGGRDGFLYGIDAETGTQKWKITHDSASWILSTAISENTLYAGSGSAFIVQASDLQTGKEKWRFKTKSAVFSSISITQNTLYFADLSGVVYALNKLTGEKKWEYAAGTRIFSTPVAFNETIYFGSDDGNLYALKGTSDELLEKNTIKKIVYWEGPKSDSSFLAFQYNTDLWLRDYFVVAGYDLMNSNQLIDFIKTQQNKKIHSVIVFADNKIPIELMEDYSENSLLRKYLNEGGKIAVFGDNPIAYILDSTSGVLQDIDFNLPQKILGITFVEPKNARGYYPSAITKEGKKYGLHDFWVGNGAVIEKDQATEVLAVNEFGKATAWIKNYGGTKGTGWLQFNVNSYKGIIGSQVYQLRTAIEYGIEW